jgi:molybdate transport system substrate-binding protein
MMIRRSFLALIAAASLALGGAPAAALAAETHVAVAANFTEPAKEIAAKFEAKTGHKAVLSFGSSGQFYTQIANGAPFEVFLSADTERPQKAEVDGYAVPGSRFIYAVGRLVLWSATPGLVDAKGAVLKSDKFQKLAIADPKSAPYGVAAIETMKKLGLYDQLTPKIVQGSSITQAFQFAKTGAAELGFVALSQVINEPAGSRWLVPAADHTPIEQGAVLLKTGSDKVAAKAFLQFLKGPEAKAVIKRYGYEAR